MVNLFSEAKEYLSSECKCFLFDEAAMVSLERILAVRKLLEFHCYFEQRADDCGRHTQTQQTNSHRCNSFGT